MLTLQLGNSFFSLDTIFTYPIDLTGDGGAWSTDFDLPATPEALQALRVDVLLGQYIPTPVAGYIHNGGSDIFPCLVYVRGYHDDIVEAYLTLNVVPAMYNRKVAEIEGGTLLSTPFDYMTSASALPYTTHNYDNGRGYGQDNGAFPSIQARHAVQLLINRAGGSVDVSNIPANLYITINTIWPSPAVKSFICSYVLATGGYYQQPTYYAQLTGITTQGLSGYILQYTLRGSGTLTNVRAGAQCTGGWDVEFNLSGIVVASGSFAAPGTHTLPDITYYDGDQLRISIICAGGVMQNGQVDWHFGTPTAEYSDEAYQLPPATIPLVPTSTSFCQTSIFACIRQTLAQLCSDIAAVSGLVLVFRGGTLRFAAPSCRVIDRYSITRYGVLNDDVAQVNVATYANDSNDTPHRDVLQTYSHTDLEEEKVLLTLSADQADKVNGIASFKQWENDGSWHFTEYGHGYWLGTLDSNNNLVPAVAKSTLLPPSTSQLMSVEAVVFEDISQAIMIAMAGREWFITEREQTADGIYTIKAILL